MNIPQNKLDKAKELIIEAAKNKGRLWYSDLYTAIGLDTVNPGDRNLGAHILGAISEESQKDDGIMLSAIVNGKNEGEPAEGFYDLAVELNRLPANATEDDKLAFWVEEFRRCHQHYAA